MTEAKKVHIVGMSDDGLQGLTSGARECLAAADLVIGESLLLRQVPDSTAEAWDPEGDLDAVVDRIANHPQQQLGFTGSGRTQHQPMGD